MWHKLYRLGLELQYRWAMSNAYLTQFGSPVASAQWYQEADHWRMELWRFDRGLL